MQKCNKVRCLHCGYVRAKNTTRQIEHLQECQAYLSSAEATVHLGQNGDGTSVDPSISDGATRSMLNGTHPNPNLQVHRRGPNQNKRNRDGQTMAPPAVPTTPASTVPSLTAHLLKTSQVLFTAATQQPFLSHAGCGTLSAAPLTQWLVQDGHCARGYVRFIGQLLAKVRLPSLQNSQFHPLYRTIDLLISALNNIRREMQFFEITATKYGLHLGEEDPTHITRAYLDLFVSASSPGTSLLEGMVLLWATEHVCGFIFLPLRLATSAALRRILFCPLAKVLSLMPPCLALVVQAYRLGLRCQLLAVAQYTFYRVTHRRSSSVSDSQLDCSFLQ